MSEPAFQLELGLERDNEADLPARLHRLGLPIGSAVTLTRNRSVLVSWDERGGLRLHAGYAWAGDEVIRAIVIFIRRGTSRADRLVARRTFLTFPVDRHAPSRARRRRQPAPVEHRPEIDRLERLHEILNKRHFSGGLTTIPIRLSERMQRRLGEFEATRDSKPWAITLSLRHLRRDGWDAAAETLLHEMVHQWQCEEGHPLNHGQTFRWKARDVGISARATRK